MWVCAFPMDEWNLSQAHQHLLVVFNKNVTILRSNINITINCFNNKSCYRISQRISIISRETWVESILNQIKLSWRSNPNKTSWNGIECTCIISGDNQPCVMSSMSVIEYFSRIKLNAIVPHVVLSLLTGTRSMSTPLTQLFGFFWAQCYFCLDAC